MATSKSPKRTARIETRKKARTATRTGSKQAYKVPAGLTTAEGKRRYVGCRDRGGSPTECERAAWDAERRAKRNSR